MLEDLLESLDAFESVLDIVAVLIADDPELKHKIIVQRRFYDLRMKFEDISEDINLKYNYMDYIAAVDIVLARGYASIAEISRKLGIIYGESYKLIERMEENGIVIKGIPPDGHEGVRIVNPDYDPESSPFKE